MENESSVRFGPRDYIVVGVILAVTLLTRLYNYILFHSVTEIFIIVIASSIFVLGWNSRRFIKDNNYFLLVSLAYLFVGIVEGVHALAYKGMGVFPEFDANLPTQLWLLTRYVLSISLLAAPFFITRKLMLRTTFTAYCVMVGLGLLAVFLRAFPDAFIEGVGLTPFKVISEYAVCLILLASVILLVRMRRHFNSGVFQLLVASMVTTILAELAFTLYSDVYGITNMLGHLLLIVSFYLVYKAIIETGISSPFSLLFRSLKQNEIALQKREQWFSSLFQESPLGVAVYGPDGMLQDINRSFSEMFSISDVTTVKGHLLFDDPTINSEAIIALRRGETVKYEVAFSGGNYRNSAIYGKVSPEVCNVEVLIKPLFLKPEKSLEGYLMQVQDITEPKRLDQVKDEFIGMVSHEMRTPLTIIIGSLDTAITERDMLKIDEREMLLKEALKESEALAHMLENLLELSRVQANRLSLHSGPVDLKSSVDSVLEKIRSLSSRQFIIDIPEDLPEIEADKTRIECVIYNLVENAVKYSPGGSDISLRARQDADRVTVSVTDRGIGISPHDQQRLFQLFQRLEVPETTQAGGSGIGLVVCKRLIEAHGGTIQVESAPHKGSTFHFTVPLRKSNRAGKFPARF